MKHLFLLMILFSFSFSVFAEESVVGEVESDCLAMAESNDRVSTKQIKVEDGSDEIRTKSTAIGQ